MLLDYNKIEALTSMMIESSSALLDISLFICSLGMFAYLISVFFIPMSAGKEIEVNRIIRPFAITFLLMLYPEVVGAINGIGSVITKEMKNSIEVQLEKNDYSEQRKNFEKYLLAERKKDLEKSISEDYDKMSSKEKEVLAVGENKSVDQSKIDKSKKDVEVMKKEAEMSWSEKVIAKMAQGFVNWLAEVCRDILLLVRSVILSFIIIAGPFMISLSMFPAWKEGLNSFFSKFIGVYMWYPIALLFDLIFHNVSAFVIFQSNSFYEVVKNYGGSVKAMAEAHQFVTGLSVSIMLGLVMAFVYFSIPTLAGWLVPNGGGDGGVTENMSRGLAVGAGVAGGMYGGVVGSTAKGVTKISPVVKKTYSAIKDYAVSKFSNVGSGGQQSTE